MLLFPVLFATFTGKFGIIYRGYLKDNNMENRTEVAVKTVQGKII